MPCRPPALRAVGTGIQSVETVLRSSYQSSYYLLTASPLSANTACSYGTHDSSYCSSSLSHGPASSICTGSVCWENQLFCIWVDNDAVRMSRQRKSKYPGSGVSRWIWKEHFCLCMGTCPMPLCVNGYDLFQKKEENPGKCRTNDLRETTVFGI